MPTKTCVILGLQYFILVFEKLQTINMTINKIVVIYMI